MSHQDSVTADAHAQSSGTDLPEVEATEGSEQAHLAPARRPDAPAQKGGIKGGGRGGVKGGRQQNPLDQEQDETYLDARGMPVLNEQAHEGLRNVVKLLLAGEQQEADRLLDSLSRKVRGTSNKAFYHAMIHACAQANNSDAAGWCAVRMVRKNIKPNNVTFNSIIDACAKAGDVDLAQKWWEQMSSLGLKPNAVTYNSMISTCSRARDATRAEVWMERMLGEGIVPCIVSFSTVIDAFAKLGQVDKAVEWLHRTQQSGVKADAVIYNSLINACAKAGSPQKAEHWLSQMQQHGLVTDETTFNSLISACAKAGNITRAEHWFKEMQTAGCRIDEITFGSLMHASAKAGNVKRALFWMKEMNKCGLKPNLVCFNTVLHACARSSDCVKAEEWFQRMLAAQIRPNKITYNSMIDAYASARQEDNATEWLRRMIIENFQPDSVTLITLQRAVGGNEEAAYIEIIKACGSVRQSTIMRKWIAQMSEAGYSAPRDLVDLCQELELERNSQGGKGKGRQKGPTNDVVQCRTGGKPTKGGKSPGGYDSDAIAMAISRVAGSNINPATSFGASSSHIDYGLPRRTHVSSSSSSSSQPVVPHRAFMLVNEPDHAQHALYTPYDPGSWQGASPELVGSISPQRLQIDGMPSAGGTHSWQQQTSSTVMPYRQPSRVSVQQFADMPHQ
eukprot:gnl/TRDRNA2_/TRDRNA2_48676_c0_seq1.p1 gnl/TRDRNA2_/TRDRNA2_48676_c0~~gnl/TRDRNA2_/TRDRNA2_48676_c0_seq1.p1  ORF type:complete len:676 (+),score=95.27 gnl/TRDRNA2_/TRDRNA2_48676_c0_seq1:43-2070(+)